MSVSERIDSTLYVSDEDVKRVHQDFNRYDYVKACRAVADLAINAYAVKVGAIRRRVDMFLPADEVDDLADRSEPYILFNKAQRVASDIPVTVFIREPKPARTDAERIREALAEFSKWEPSRHPTTKECVCGNCISHRMNRILRGEGE